MSEILDSVHKAILSALQVDVLHFRYVYPFRNQSASEATRVINFLTSVKFRGSVG